MTQHRWTTRALDASTLEVSIRDERERAISTRGWLTALHDDATFRASFVQGLREAPFPAFFFEVAPVTAASADGDLAFVLVAARALENVVADRDAFAEHFDRDAGDVLVFPNLGRDATLVVPAPRARAHAAYAHLAAFVRGAPPAQVDAFFERLGRAAAAKLGAAPLWISTAGLGVSWLHLRLDSRPKYYRHDPFRRAR